MNKLLDVYLHDTYAGQLFHNNEGKIEFTYAPSYLAENMPALSVSLPLQAQTYKDNVTKPFFSGLLPDDQARHKIAKCLGISAENAFSLLKAIGGECAGAISMYPAGQTPTAITPSNNEILHGHTLEQMLSTLTKRPLLVGEHGLRLSLAGAQNKLAIGFHEGHIILVKGSSHTTHILKPMIPDYPNSVYNEYFCMKLANMVGIETPNVQIYEINHIPYYLIERYDRFLDHTGVISRLHQEDFCQALSVLPENKYEREGGPNIIQSMNLLRVYSAEPAADQVKLIKRIIFNFIIGNADAHGKNFSLLYKKASHRPMLAPAYDLLSTTIYPELSLKMAMKIGGKYVPTDVALRHWHRIVMDNAIARKNMNNQLKIMASTCVEKAVELGRILKTEHTHVDVFDKIISIIRSRALHIQRVLDEDLSL